MALDNIYVKTETIFDATVTLIGGIVYSDDIVNYRKGGFNIRVQSNDPAGDIVASLSVESWDSELGWIAEPLVSFAQNPDGTSRKTSDTFINTQADKYRVKIEPTGGTSGPVKIVYATQTSM